MATTSNMGFPLLDATQLSRDVTSNMAKRMLDWQMSGTRTAINFTNTPPASPVDGDTYLLNTAPTGVWTGQAGKIAYYQNGAYVYRTPQTGEFYYDQTANAFKTWNGSAWVAGPS